MKNRPNTNITNLNYTLNYFIALTVTLFMSVWTRGAIWVKISWEKWLFKMVIFPPPGDPCSWKAPRVKCPYLCVSHSDWLDQYFPLTILTSFDSADLFLEGKHRPPVILQIVRRRCGESVKFLRLHLDPLSPILPCSMPVTTSFLCLLTIGGSYHLSASFRMPFFSIEQASP